MVSEAGERRACTTGEQFIVKHRRRRRRPSTRRAPCRLCQKRQHSTPSLAMKCLSGSGPAVEFVTEWRLSSAGVRVRYVEVCGAEVTECRRVKQVR